MNRFTALSLAGLAACAGLGAVVVELYGGRDLSSELVGSFAGTLVAFMLALAWERERELRRAQDDASELTARRVTEVRRRLEPIRTELEKNLQSVKDSLGHLQPDDSRFMLSNPQLLEGAWNASAPRLSELLEDVKLVADLSVTYGRLEELRWRLRQRTEHRTAALDNMTLPLLAQLGREIEDLLERIDREIRGPSVQTTGVALNLTLGGGIGPAGALTVEKIASPETGPQPGPNRPPPA